MAEAPIVGPTFGPALPPVPTTEMRDEIEHVVATFARQAKRQLDHDRLSIYLLTPDGSGLERFAVATSPVIPGESDVIDLDHVGIAHVIRRNEGLVSGEFSTDQRILGKEDSVIAAAGFHAIVSVPLRMGARPIGLLNFVSRTPDFYVEEDIEFAQQIADQIAGFLLNLRVQRATRLLVERQAVERERNRVAREFHDTLAQALSALAVKADLLAESVTTLDTSTWGHATAVRDLAQRALEDVRRSLHDLMPAELEGASLVTAIEARLDELSAASGVATQLRVSGDGRDLPDDVTIAAFRIFQQALANAYQHAQASSIRVEVRTGPGLFLAVRDNGCGLPAPRPGEGQDSFGMKIMRDRARAIGGELAISSDDGQGTAVVLRVEAAPAGPVAPPAMALRPSTGPVVRQVIRVLVVDDHAMVREGLCDLLRHEDDIRIVGEAGTGRDGLRAVRRLRPDVVLLDLELPDMTGIEVAAAVAGECPDTTVLMMSAFAEDENVASAVAAGARGYIAKSTSLEPLVRAIRTASQGVEVFSVGTRPEADGALLTDRELAVLTGLARGRTNAELARELHLAIKTIERIVATIVTKLGARNRTHAVAKALSRRLVAPRGIGV